MADARTQAIAMDEAIEAIRVASFEAPKAASHSEWAGRIAAILTLYRLATEDETP